MNEKYIILAKKLKALADKGIDGEKVNAQKMLEALLKKHNLTILDIEAESKNDYFFKLKDADHRLWQQIVKRVGKDIPCYGPIPAKVLKDFKFKGNYLITCTASQYVEVEAMFAIYSKHLVKEYDIFYRAFCTANDLLVERGEDDPKDESELSAEELKAFRRSLLMAENIKKETYRKQLRHENNL
jgi:hypothetical protein